MTLDVISQKVGNLLTWVEKVHQYDVDTLLKALSRVTALLGYAYTLQADLIAESDTVHYNRKIMELAAINRYRNQKLKVDEAKEKAAEEMRERITEEINLNRDVNLLKGYVETLQKIIGLINVAIKIKSNKGYDGDKRANGISTSLRGARGDRGQDKAVIQKQQEQASQRAPETGNSSIESQAENKQVQVVNSRKNADIIEGRELDKTFEEIFS